MDGTDPIHVWMIFYLWLYRLEYIGEFQFSLNQVDDGEEAVAVQYFLGEWAYLVGEIGKDSDDFLSLFSFQFAHAVVGLHHFGWLDEDGLSGGTLVVNDTLDSALEGRDDRDNQSAVAQGWGNIFLYDAFALCRAQNTI